MIKNSVIIKVDYTELEEAYNEVERIIISSKNNEGGN